MKDKLKEIIRSPTTIDLVLNLLSNDEIIRFEAIFPKIKAEYIKLYGSKNDKITAEEIVEFFHNVEKGINKIDNEGDIIPNQEFINGHDLTEDEIGRLATRTYSIQNDIKNKYTNHKEAGYKTVPIEVMRERIRNNWNEDIKAISLEDQWGNKKKSQRLIKDVEDIIRRDPRGFYQSDFEHNLQLVGFGLNKKNIPERAQFGNIIIFLKKLYYNNMLSIRDRNGYIIPSNNVVKVSDEFVQIIFKIIEGKSITEEFKKLSISERQLYDHLLFLAGLHKDNKNSSSKTISHLKEQYKILTGEIEAGNDNPDLLKQLKAVLYHLHQFKVITQGEVKNTLKDVKNLLKDKK